MKKIKVIWRQTPTNEKKRKKKTKKGSKKNHKKV